MAMVTSATRSKKPTQKPASVDKTVKTAIKEGFTESLISAEERLEMIAEAAYYCAEARKFKPGDQDQDWLEAEALIDNMLSEAVKKAKI